MKSIAEYAGGEFFFLESAQVIPTLVGKALENLVTAIGTDANLKFRGKNDCIIRKVYQHPDLVGGAKLGDIHSDNIRQILLQVEIATTKREEECEFVSYEFSYLPTKDENPTRVLSTGVLKFKLTDDDTLVKEQNPQVQVLLVIQQSADSDLEIQNFIKNRDTKNALSTQEKQIVELKSVLHIDQSGMIQILLKIAEKNLAKLKTEGSSKNMEQNYSHGNYMKGRCSQKYMAHYDED